MTIHSIVCTKLLCTNAHLGRQVTAHHFKVYICGSRNGIAILDSDKTLICLRNALHFIGSPIRQKGRSFFLKTNHLFRYEIMEEMASCINDSQWKIGAFFTNSFANKKKFHSRKKKINFGLNQQPDCTVILNADRKSSVILEAVRSQIPIASLVDSTIPWESNKRITYSIPANDPIQFVYLFRHSITKTGILERPRIQKMKVDRPRALRHFTLSTGKSAGKRPYSTTFYDFFPSDLFCHSLYLFLCLLGVIHFMESSGQKRGRISSVSEASSSFSTPPGDDDKNNEKRKKLVGHQDADAARKQMELDFRAKARSLEEEITRMLFKGERKKAKFTFQDPEGIREVTHKFLIHKGLVERQPSEEGLKKLGAELYYLQKKTLGRGSPLYKELVEYLCGQKELKDFMPQNWLPDLNK